MAWRETLAVAASRRSQVCSYKLLVRAAPERPPAPFPSACHVEYGISREALERRLRATADGRLTACNGAACSLSLTLTNDQLLVLRRWPLYALSQANSTFASSTRARDASLRE